MSLTELPSTSPLESHRSNSLTAERASAGTSVTFDMIAMVLFTVSIFTSATLLFVVQPMVGKLLLPKLGGAPAVWNTCMLFFQATLLAGYFCAHLMTKYLPLRSQVLLFVAGLVLALTRLPLSVDPRSIDALLRGADPNFWLLGVLVSRVAPVFFMLSITSPLLQKWFARTGHPRGDDPYFLYSASNIGSILSLVLYPFLFEVSWGVSAQATGWMWGFGAFISLAALCGFVSCVGAARPRNRASETLSATATPSTMNAQPVTWARRGYWVILSVIPSSLMLGVITYISTDVSSVPLIWIIPLTIYLLTFVLAFGQRQWITPYRLGRIAALLILAITFTMVTGANDPPGLIIPLHLLMFGAVALFCHQRLAADRPDPSHLTEFYLWMSIGGVLGGLCNALLAPVLFATIFEYPLAMLVALLVRETRPADEADAPSSWNVMKFGMAMLLLTIGLGQLVDVEMPAAWLAPITKILPLSVDQVKMLLRFGLPAVLVLSQLNRRTCFTVGLGAMLFVNAWERSIDEKTIERDRNFYGTLATARDTLAGGEVLRMVHGNTIHGWQWTDAARRGIPLSYYGNHSGVGQLIQTWQAASDRPLRIGAVGLGAGSLAAWLRPGDTIVFYEINPQVVDHAERHFSYLSDARQRGATVEVRTGDARLVLEAEQRSQTSPPYDLLLVDAFSSDSIPVHLVTEEACNIYRSIVQPQGVVAFHITNRYLNLEPVLATLARRAAWSGFRYDFRELSNVTGIDQKTGETVSAWVLLTAQPANLGTLGQDSHLRPLVERPDQRVWTDDYSNLLSVFE